MTPTLDLLQANLRPGLTVAIVATPADPSFVITYHCRNPARALSLYEGLSRLGLVKAELVFTPPPEVLHEGYARFDLDTPLDRDPP